jgi:predicted nucleotidyltransferase
MTKYSTRYRNSVIVTGVDLRHPLRSLVPSLDWAVLEVLAGTESGLGASQIARLSHDGSRSGQAPILDRLVRQGLVIAEPANQGFLYRLNRSHLLASAILDVAGLRGRLLALLSAQVRQLTPMPVHASVFGSFARGEAGDESDIDLLLIAATDQDVEEWESAIDRIEANLRLWTGNGCSCMAFRLERVRELVASGEPIVDNWVADGVLLLGDPLQRILGEAITPTTAGRRAQ